MIRNKTGIWGEIYTARYLRDRGCDIIGSNFKCRFGEADIIAAEGEKMLIVEVKTRNESATLRPMEAVDENKRDRLEKTAQVFIKASGLTDLHPRFDVAEVYLNDDYELVSLNYIENAFSSEHNSL
jgi:putative endonuclease